MPRIPLHFHQPAATPQSTVRADPGMFEPLNRGAQSIAQGVSALGNVAGDFAQKLQAAEDFRIQSDTEIALQKNNDDFLDRMKLIEDESQWVEQYDKSIQDTLKAIAPKKKASARGQAQIDAYVAKFTARTTSEIKHTATARSIDRAKQAGFNRMEQAKRHLDYEGYEDAVSGLEQHSLITPQEAEKLRIEAAGQFDAQRAINDALGDASATLEALKAKTESGEWVNYTNLDAQQRNAAITNAEVQFNKKRGEALDDFTARQTAGEEIPQIEINQALEQKLITKTTAAKMTRDGRLQAEKNTAAQRSLYLDVMNRISAYDPKTSSLEERFDIQNDLARLVGENQNDAVRAFKEKSDPKSPQNSPAAKQAFGIIELNFRNGIYGDWKTQLVYQTDENGEPILDRNKEKQVLFDAVGQPVRKANKKQLEAALAKKARIHDALSAYIRANPNATFEQLQNFLAATNAADIQRTGSEAFQSIDFGAPAK